MAGRAAADDSFATPVSSLTSLAHHVHASIEMIDSAIARAIIGDGIEAGRRITTS
jgi:hypothetical protein